MEDIICNGLNEHAYVPLVADLDKQLEIKATHAPLLVRSNSLLLCESGAKWSEILIDMASGRIKVVNNLSA